MDQTLSEYLKIQQNKIGFSGVVVIANKDGIIAQQAIGLASKELNVPIAIDSRFKIASMTKSFTGLLVTLAETEGKLKIDDKLEAYFPELQNKRWRQITIGQLLAHTSGIPHWSGFKDYWTVYSFLPLQQDTILDKIFRMDLLFDPGTNSDYSSPAYYLLAVILEKIYASDYKSILEEKILVPLQLTQTNAFDGLAIIPNMTTGYHLISDDSIIVAPPRSMATMKGGGNLYATASDMSKWCQSFLANNTWNDSVLHKIFTPDSNHKMEHKNGSAYARGWYISEKTTTGSKAFHVGGGTFGFTSKAAIYPAEKISIVILSNVSFLPIDDIIWKDIEQIAFEKPFEMPKEYPKEIKLDSNELQKFSGTYQAKNGMKLEIILHQQKLILKLGTNPSFEIYPQEQKIFFSKKIDVVFYFETSDTGIVTGLQAKGKGRIDFFEKQ